jgi:hypothetical protein
MSVKVASGNAGTQRLSHESRYDEQRTAAQQRIAAINAFPVSAFERHRSLRVSASRIEI